MIAVASGRDAEGDRVDHLWTRVPSAVGVRRDTDMSGIVLRVAQVVGVLVLAGIAVGVVVGFVQWLLGVALIVAIPIGAWWVYRQVSDHRRKPMTGRTTDRRSELESRAVLDAAGRCGWCGSPSLHRDDFGFPVTPLAHHRAEIDAML